MGWQGRTGGPGRRRVVGCWLFVGHEHGARSGCAAPVRTNSKPTIIACSTRARSAPY